jgi:DNA repair exonuclease SbcCD ATPase subunit
LGGAADVNTLNKSLTDLITALKSKEAAAASEDVGRDLSSVQALQKKHNDLARDVTALAEKAKVLNADVDKTAAANPKTAPALLKKQAELNETLARVQDLVGSRGKKLEDAEDLANFSAQHAEAHDWLAERSAEVDAAEQPKDAASAQALLKKHDALKVPWPCAVWP